MHNSSSIYQYNDNAIVGEVFQSWGFSEELQESRCEDARGALLPLKALPGVIHVA